MILAISPPVDGLNNLIDGLLSVFSCIAKVLVGDTLLIPTLPLPLMRKLSDPDVLNAYALLSAVDE